MSCASVRVIAVGYLLILLSGCAAVESGVVKDPPPAATDTEKLPFATPDGTVYFMPRRPFIVTVTRAQVSAGVPNPPTTVTVSQSSVAQADLTHQFVLQQGTNWLAKNEMNITIGTNGLLKTSNTTASSEVATALQNLASSVAVFAGVPAAPMASPMLSGTVASPRAPTDACPSPGGTYQYLIYPELRDDTTQLTTFCSYTVTWTQPQVRVPNRRFIEGGLGYSGVFYRHEIPYVVTVTSSEDKTVSKWLLTSPDESEIDFLPVKRSFFANNTANISLTDGVLTGIDQTTEGELTAALGLPATVISSYTTAVGNLLSGLTTNSSDVQKLLSQQQATAATQAKDAVCRATITANPTKGLTGDDLTKAVAAITSACGGS